MKTLTRNTGVPRAGSESGMTLIELMVVGAIIAIAVALGMPNYRLWTTKFQLKEGVAELHSTMSLARMAAMNQNTSVTVTPVLAGTQLNVAFTNPTGGIVLAPFVKTVNATTVMTTTPPNTITFNSMGLRVGGPAGALQTFVFTSNGLVYSIGVNPAGKVRWCPNNSGVCQ
jgi:prepilin-type N-terminal cleavage/methylation domain-containing protein